MTDKIKINQELFNLLKDHKTEQLKKTIINLEKNFNFHIRDNNSAFFINYVVLFNNTEILEEILKKKCNLDVLDNNGKSLLYYPVIFGFYAIIDILLKYNKNNIGVSLLDIRDTSGKIALHYALEKNDLEIIKKFINHSSNVNYCDNNGNNSLHYAVKTRNYDIVKIIIPNIGNIDATTKDGETALHIATNLQLESIANLLITNKANVNALDFDNELSCLHYTASNGNKNIAEILLSNKANPNIQDIYGNTPIHYAIIEDNVDFFLFMLKEKNAANILNFNLWNIESKIPLHFILEKLLPFETPEYLELVINKSDLTIQDSEGNSCLHLIIKLKLWKIFYNVLTKKKLDIFMRNNNNEAPINLIIPEDYDKFFSLVAESYYNILNTRNYKWTEDIDIMCGNEKSSNTKDKCLTLIKKKIMEDAKRFNESKQNICYLKSFPVKHKECALVEEGEKVNVCFFAGTTLDIFFGLIFLLQKHKDISCGVIEKNFVKNNDLVNFYKSIGIMKNPRGELLNFEILWINYKLHFIKNFSCLFESCIRQKKKYIIIPLGIEINYKNHANYMIYDVSQKELERFEPHGGTFPIGFNYNSKLLDELLEQHFKKINPQIKYFRPDSFIPKIGFQNMDIRESKFSRIGDPGGFCALWSIWYTDMRLSHSEINRKNLVLSLIRTIRSNHISFRNLIRNYSKHITDIRDNIFKEINIDINDWINDAISNNQLNLLISKLEDILLSIQPSCSIQPT